MKTLTSLTWDEYNSKFPRDEIWKYRDVSCDICGEEIWSMGGSAGIKCFNLVEKQERDEIIIVCNSCLKNY